MTEEAAQEMAEGICQFAQKVWDLKMKEDSGKTIVEILPESSNVFSSAIATLIFMWQGLIDYKLGAILAVTMFIGAYIGAHTVTKLSDIWLKRIFISVVLVLAVKTLLDFGF